MSPFPSTAIHCAIKGAKSLLNLTVLIKVDYNLTDDCKFEVMN